MVVSSLIRLIVCGYSMLSLIVLFDVIDGIVEGVFGFFIIVVECRCFPL
jgi:hypothetical protein